MKNILQLLLTPYLLVSRLVDKSPDISPKLLTFIKNTLVALGAGFAVFFIMLGLWTAKTVMYEATSDMKSVGYKVCVEYGYDDPRMGQSCEDYEYRYEGIGYRILGHLRESMLWGGAVFVGAYYFLYKRVKV